MRGVKMEPGTEDGNLADPVLLNKIDQLFTCGVGDYIALPQLVVVGDQSSGRSSVLEGLTNLPFPRDSGLCTRFATQITFRRAAEAKISVSIIAAKNASIKHATRVQSFREDGLSNLDTDRFSSIMQKVYECMGIGKSEDANGKATFSDDVLKLDICGPDQEHSSVVDVPGIFRKTTEGLTTKEDREMVKAMVRGFMENPRSVMLTVIPANVDIATQEILEMAKEVDDDGHRTLGVLTKPDLVDQGAEASVLDLVNGQRHKLTLGWCIVRNPGQQQLDSPQTNRDAIENLFFRTVVPWNHLDPDRVGIGALRIRLKEILTENIRNEFPKVRAEIGKRLKSAETSLSDLGEKRQTTSEQRQFLLNKSADFQSTLALALNTNYVHSAWFYEDPNLKLATIVVNRCQSFQKLVERTGHTYSFEVLAEAEPSNDESSEGLLLSQPGCLKVRETEDHPDLDEIEFEGSDIDGANPSGILEWLKGVYEGARGFELGTFDAGLLATTMKLQSSKWAPIALGYVSDIVNFAHSFIRGLLQKIFSDKRICDGIMSVMMDTLLSKYRKAIETVRLLLDVERVEVPTTQNHYFNENLEKSRKNRMQKQASGKALDAQTYSKGPWEKMVRLNDIVQSHPLSNTDHLVRDLHDILQAYYKVARKRFVDNVCMLVAYHQLITGPDTPLKLFSTKLVTSLSDQQLEEIACEDASLRRKRAALNKEIENLRAGKKILF